MKKLLLALVPVTIGIALAIAVIRSKTDMVILERFVDGIPVIEIAGGLDSAGARTIVRALRRAEAARPAFVVLAFDSPGGELSGTLEVADTISGLSVPTVAFVSEGVSGTMFMIAATDVIYMAPTGVCGSAAPIVMSGDVQIDERSQEILTFAGSKMRTYAEASGHDPSVLEAMMDPGVELARNGRVWKAKGTLLSLTAREATVIGLSVGIAPSVEEVIASQKTKKTEANQALQTTPMTRSEI